MGSPRITDSVDKCVLDSCCSCVASGAVLFTCQFVCFLSILGVISKALHMQGKCSITNLFLYPMVLLIHNLTT